MPLKFWQNLDLFLIAVAYIKYTFIIYAAIAMYTIFNFIVSFTLFLNIKKLLESKISNSFFF